VILLTYEEKLKTAEKLRASNFVDPVFSDEYLSFQNLVDIEDTHISTSEGETHVFIHRAHDRGSRCPVFINIHGGGFVRPHMPCNRYFSARIAAEIRGITVDIDYKLAPEYPYPAAFNECFDVVEWVYKNAAVLGASVDNIIIGGHSAGANLALAVVMKRKFMQKKLPKLQILDFGAFDMASDPSEKEGAAGNVLSVERIKEFNLLYTDNDPRILYSPYCSPVYCPDEEFIGLPQTLVITAGRDSLKNEAESLGKRFTEQGVAVTLKRFLNSNHGFTVQCTGEWEASQQLILDTVMQVI